MSALSVLSCYPSFDVYHLSFFFFLVFNLSFIIFYVASLVHLCLIISLEHYSLMKESRRQTLRHIRVEVFPKENFFAIQLDRNIYEFSPR